MVALKGQSFDIILETFYALFKTNITPSQTNVSDHNKKPCFCNIYIIDFIELLVRLKVYRIYTIWLKNFQRLKKLGQFDKEPKIYKLPLKSNEKIYSKNLIW